jgi:phospholipid/cholesterol/gamma-HCH transport system ATP-binding protein
MSLSESSVRLEAVCFGYETPGVRRHSPLVLSDLSFEVPEHSMVCLVGRTGSGKSTCLRLVTLLEKPFSGEVYLWGKRTSRADRKETMSLRKEMGVCFQHDGLFDSLCCIENLTFPLRERMKLSAREASAVAEKALDQVSLCDFGSLRIHELSGGMKKRLSLARAFLFKPRLLCLDDPTAGLDPVTGAQLTQLVAALVKENRATLLVATADVGSVRGLCDQVVFLSEARAVFSENIDAFLACDNNAVRDFREGVGYSS